MISQLLLTFACVPQPLCVPAPVPIHLSPQEQEVADRLPEIKELLELLGKYISRRGKEDVAAIRLMEQLAIQYPKCGPKDRESIAKAIGKCFAQKRKEIAKDQPDNALYLPAATHLGTMGENATKILVKWIEHKSHRDNLVLKRELIMSLGLTKDTGALKCLSDLLQYNDANVIAWAAEAFGQFKGHPQKVRKEIFSDILKVLVTTSEQKEDANNLEASARWEAIKVPMFRTLGSLSGERNSNAAAWQRWWNKNKRKNWDEKSDK